ncbi:MAG: VOC family protein [Paracoccaceae bacterium]
MYALTASPCITTNKIAETKAFYRHYFAAEPSFDCGWYVSLDFPGGLSIQFIEPQPGQPLCDPRGLTYNFLVEDVDAAHAALEAKGLTPSLAIADHPWGDRGFAVTDPNGILLYIYAERPPSAEFAPFVLKQSARHVAR